MKSAKVVAIVIRQGEKLTLKEMARHLKVKLPDSMVVRSLTASHVETIAAWSPTTVRITVTHLRRCEATLANYVHAAVKGTRLGKCLVTLTMRKEDRTVVRRAMLEIKGAKATERTALVGMVR